MNLFPNVSQNEMILFFQGKKKKKEKEDWNPTVNTLSASGPALYSI